MERTGIRNPTSSLASGLSQDFIPNNVQLASVFKTVNLIRETLGEGECRAKRHPAFGRFWLGAENLWLTGGSLGERRETPDLPQTFLGESVPGTGFKVGLEGLGAAFVWNGFAGDRHTTILRASRFGGRRRNPGLPVHERRPFRQRYQSFADGEARPSPEIR